MCAQPRAAAQTSAGPGVSATEQPPARPDEGEGGGEGGGEEEREVEHERYALRNKGTRSFPPHCQSKPSAPE